MADIDLEGFEGPFWASAITLYGVGDLITTWVGFQQSGVTESNPVSATILSQFGFSGLIMWKLLVIIAFIFAQVFVPDEWQIAIPMGLTLVGAWVVWNNIQVINQAEQIEARPATYGLPAIVESEVAVG